MDVKQYLDSTYLKTAEQANLSEEKNTEVVAGFVQEAITHNFKLIMIRPDQVVLAKEMIQNANSKVTIGTVIDFPNGDGALEDKLSEAATAIENGADDLDFVIDYKAFQNDEIDKVKLQVLEGTKLGLQHHKIVKWIIEVAALNDHQIIQLSVLIKNVVMDHFKESDYEKVFVKSSTGFYKTPEGVPNGATVPAIKLMLENSFPLSVKAAGGVRTYQEAVEMINMMFSEYNSNVQKVIKKALIF